MIDQSCFNSKEQEAQLMLRKQRDRMFYVNRVISYRFRDKREFQSKMHLTPSSRIILTFIKVI